MFRNLFICLFIGHLSYFVYAEQKYNYIYKRLEEVVPNVSPGKLDYFKETSLEEFPPRVTGEKNTECYLAYNAKEDNWLAFFKNAYIAIKVPVDEKAAGTFWSFGQSHYNSSDRWIDGHKWGLEATTANAEGQKQFYRAKTLHYHRLLSQSGGGKPWLYYQREVAHKQYQELSKEKISFPSIRTNEIAQEISSTFDLLTGHKAINENLPLEVLQNEEGEANIAIETLPSINVSAIEWQRILGEKKPKLDILATAIPADQHGIFFPSYSSFWTFSEVAKQGSPVLDLLKSRSEDSQYLKKYFHQLGFSPKQNLHFALDVESVVVTSSDLEMQLGTDLAIIFETKSESKFYEEVMEGFYKIGEQETETTVQVEKISDIEICVMLNPTRTRSSYLCQVDGKVFLTNSRQQLEILLATVQKKQSSIADLEEYVFFRQRYLLSEPETAFLIITDPTIRRWGSARWRIGVSRRVKAARQIGYLQAAHLKEIVAGDLSKEIVLNTPIKNLGKLSLTSVGIHSTTYGNLLFMTPIREMEINKVTNAEAKNYKSFHRDYQRQWVRFDPIGIRFYLDKSKFGVDVSVIPLTINSDYHYFLYYLSSGKQQPSHDANSWFEIYGNYRSHSTNELSFILYYLAQYSNIPLEDWWGGGVRLTGVSGSFWRMLQFLEQEDLGNIVRRLAKVNRRNWNKLFNWYFWRLPLALRLESENQEKLRQFILSLHEKILAEPYAQDDIAIKSFEYKGVPCFHFGPSKKSYEGDSRLQRLQPGFFYGVTSDEFVLCLRKEYLQRIIDDKLSNTESNDENNANSELENISWSCKTEFVDLVAKALYKEISTHATQSSWRNLDILNEWQKIYPDKNPLEIHQKVWKSKLTCPLGGSYRWNNYHQTMESSKVMHPQNPSRYPIDIPAPWNSFSYLEGGFTFEHGGVRARFIFHKEKK